MLAIHAPAKINLSLEIVGRRADRFHDLVSVMQTVSLHDVLELTPSDDLELSCSDPALQSSDNLVLQAARALRDTCAVERGCSIRLEKRIPAAAGLGGGSSDGAAALVALARFWSLRLERDDLIPMAEQLGSDVPFFLYGGTALVEGRGERVRPLSASPRSWFVLSKPPLSVSTADVFKELKASDWTDGRTTRALARTIEAEGELRLGTNSLQEALFRLCPPAQAHFDLMRSATPHDTMITGSGPTVVAVSPSEEEALHLSSALQAQHCWAATVQSVTPQGVLSA